MVIRALGPADVTPFLSLRRRGLVEEPSSFAASPEDDRAGSEEFVRQALGDPDQSLVGAFDPELRGIVGIYRGRGLKSRHKAHIWGMYVHPDHRGKGIARRLLQSAIAWAHAQDGISHVHLVVAAHAQVARRLYASLGFETWGIEPDALLINGSLEDDEHMVLHLGRLGG